MFGVRWLKCSHVAVNCGLSERIAHVWTVCRSHVHAVELYFQFVMTKSQDTKFALEVAVDSVRLRGSNDLMFLWRPGWNQRRLILGGGCNSQSHDAQQ